MFITFLSANLLVSLLLCIVAALLFWTPLARLLARGEGESSTPWSRCLIFGVSILAIAIGTRVWDIEKFFSPSGAFELSQEQVILEIYKTAIVTMLSIALLYFVLLLSLWLASLSDKKNQPGQDNAEGEK